MQVLIIVALLAGYGLGIWKFWQGFERTNFEPTLSNRLKLSLLWPILWVGNESYRKNFRRALKGQ